MLKGPRPNRPKNVVDEAVFLKQGHPCVGAQQEVHPHGQHNQHEHDMLLVGAQAGEKIPDRERHDQAD